MFVRGKLAAEHPQARGYRGHHGELRPGPAEDEDLDAAQGGENKTMMERKTRIPWNRGEIGLFGKPPQMLRYRIVQWQMTIMKKGEDYED